MRIQQGERTLKLSNITDIRYWIGLVFALGALLQVTGKSVFWIVSDTFLPVAHSAISGFFAFIFDPFFYYAVLFFTVGAWMMTKYPLVTAVFDQSQQKFIFKSRAILSRKLIYRLDQIKEVQWCVKTLVSRQIIIYEQVRLAMADGKTLALTGEDGRYANQVTTGAFGPDHNEKQVAQTVSVFTGAPFRKIESEQDARGPVPAKYHNPVTVLKETTKAMQKDIAADLNETINDKLDSDRTDNEPEA